MFEAPPGILDLIPWKPSSDDHREDAFDLKPHLWSQLPENLLHLVLAWLPLESILRFRCVCTQWKALFESPTFHHFASHRPHIPPWIFFLGCTGRYPSACESQEETPYDDGRDDNGFVFQDDEHGDSDGDSYENASDDPRDAHDVMSHGETSDRKDAMRCGDHVDMHDVTRCGDHGETHGVGSDRVNDRNRPEELLLIFDCESESWRPTLAIPPGFKASAPQNFIARFDVCSFDEQVLIPTGSLNRLFLFNPASPSRKELPPCISIQNFEGIGLSEERAMLSSSGTSSNLSNLSSLSNENRNVEHFVQGTATKILHVVAVGDTGKGSYVVESFNSATGSWRICGYVLQSCYNIFMQRRMVFCKGSFYAKASGGIFKFDNVLGGQSMEYTFRDFMSPSSGDGPPDTDLTESRLVATKDSVFLVGVTVTYALQDWQDEDWNIVIWQFHPHASEDDCWQLLAHTPKGILDGFYGDTHISNIDCLAHGDLIFFQVPDRQRFLMYDMSQKLWRFSAKCKYYLDSMTYVWEPLLRN